MIHADLQDKFVCADGDYTEIDGDAETLKEELCQIVYQLINRKHLTGEQIAEAVNIGALMVTEDRNGEETE